MAEFPYIQVKCFRSPKTAFDGQLSPLIEVWFFNDLTFCINVYFLQEGENSLKIYHVTK